MRLAALLLSGLCATVPLAGAHAASQMLLVVATAEPVPLTCAGETCTAELTAYCLQEHRPAPRRGDVYHVADGATPFALVDDAGARTPLAVAPRISAARTYTLVMVSLPAEAVGAARGLVVGDGAILVPAPVAGDANPQTAEDIAETIGIGRAVGARIARDAPEMAIALDLSRAANALDAGAPEAELAEAARAGSEAAALIAACQGIAARGGSSVPACLRGQHDGLVSDVTQQFWRAVATGS